MNFIKKLKLVFLPFILIVIGFVCIYTFLNWFLIIKLQMINGKEMWMDLWIPIILSFISIYLLLRPRLKLLIIKNKGERDNSFPIMVAWLTTVAATVIAQLYLESSTGKLTKLDNISQINQNVKEQTKYYTLKNFFIDKTHVGVSNSFGTSGRFNTDFNMAIFIACPILVKDNFHRIVADTSSVSVKNPLVVVDGHPVNQDFFKEKITPDLIESFSFLKADAARGLYGNPGRYGALMVMTKNGIGARLVDRLQNPLPDSICAWLGIRFYKTISNRLSSEEKEEKYKEFAIQSQQKFDTMNLSSFTYLENAYSKEEYDNYSEAIDNLKKQTQKNIVIHKTIMLPVVAPFENRNGNKFAWIFGAIAIGSVIFLIVLAFTRFDSKALDNFEQGKEVESEENDESSLLELMTPKEGFYITPILIIINIAVFITMVVCGLGIISFKGKDLLVWGANYRPLTMDGQWWRLLTNTFLHGGIMHVFANMYGLLFVGIFLEPLLGKTRMLAIYLTTGILASAASIWWYEATVSVGASGAIFGLYGLFLALMVTKIFHPEFSKVFLSSTLIFVGFNLLMGFAGGIDNAAHIGGLVSGFLIGLMLYPSLKRQIQEEEEKSMNDKMF